ncbi:MAG: hypothetical protein N3E36_04580 [Sulfolobales archaeon]|nr:hypothetical protein [Sulfolobales archaeon]MCX8199291.1 hypothetical protein [Sulfolobales archaeon]MDW8170395.1 hypothetical protein [Desulfurococcaceae archaeon]
MVKEANLKFRKLIDETNFDELVDTYLTDRRSCSLCPLRAICR